MAIHGKPPIGKIAILLGFTSFVYLLLHFHPAAIPSAARSSLNNLKLQLSSTVDPKVQHPFTDYQELVWHSFERVRSRTLRSGRTIAPLHLKQLEELAAPEPFREVHIISSYLDTRPLVARKPAEVVVVATMLGRPWLDVAGATYANSPVFCYVVSKKEGQKEEEFAIVQSSLVGLPDVHSREKPVVAVIFSCPLPEDMDWDGAEVYATLSMEHLPPPSDVFVPVTPLPALDPVAHPTGKGKGAVCLPPITSDRHAPSIADFVDYYRALGFTTFYSYLLNPGPDTLAVVRELAYDDPSFVAIRWSFPTSWSKAAIGSQELSRHFAVNVSRWDVPGIDALRPDVEFGLGTAADADDSDSRIWLAGTHAALQDCQLRAMAAGHRWIATVDYDEFFHLRQPNGKSWPRPSSTSSPMDSFVAWARGLDDDWEASWVNSTMAGTMDTLTESTAASLRIDVPAITYGMLPGAVIFRSTPACARCRPRDGPSESSASIHAVRNQFPDVDWRSPGLGLPLIFTSPVRSAAFSPVPLRTRAVIDPWAWKTVSPLYPGMGFTEYTSILGQCASSATEERRSHSDIQCATLLLSALGPPTHRAIPPPVTSSSSPAAVVPNSRGSLLRMFVDSDLSQNLVSFARAQAETENPSDPIHGIESSSFLRSFRVEAGEWESEVAALRAPGQKNPRVVEDWGVVESLGPALVEILGRKVAGSSGGSWYMEGGTVLAFAAASFVAGVTLLTTRRGQKKE